METKEKKMLCIVSECKVQNLKLIRIIKNQIIVNFNDITSNANKCIYKTEIYPQTENLWLLKGKLWGRGIN